MNVIKNSKVTRMINATAVGTTTLTPGTSLDMQGFESVLFIALFGTITDGTPDLQPRQDTAVGMGTATNIGAAVSMLDADDNKVGLVEAIHPTKRYVDCQIVRGGSTGCVFDGLIAVQFGAKESPVTQDATVGAAVATYVAP